MTALFKILFLIFLMNRDKPWNRHQYVHEQNNCVSYALHESECIDYDLHIDPDRFDELALPGMETLEKPERGCLIRFYLDDNRIADKRKLSTEHMGMVTNRKFMTMKHRPGTDYPIISHMFINLYLFFHPLMGYEFLEPKKLPHLKKEDSEHDIVVLAADRKQEMEIFEKWTGNLNTLTSIM